MIPVTMWYVQQIDDKTKQNKWVYNHLEMGHCDNIIPTAINKSQHNMWAKIVWDKRLSYATDTKPMVIGA